VETIRDSSGVPIPADKVSTLIARSLHLYKGYPSSEKPRIMYDVHVAKISLKIGIVNINVENFDIIVLNLFNKKLRDTIIQAWNMVSGASGISPWHIDAFLWRVGKDHCLFDDKVGCFNKAIPCPERRSKETVTCPLKGICKAFKTAKPTVLAIFSAELSRLETVVVLKY
jgi:hypothetical protein